MTNTTKVTKKDKFAMVLEILAGVDHAEVAMLTEFVENEIALLDKKSAKAKETAANKKAEADALTVAVQGVLNDEYQTIAEVTAALDDADATAAKVAYRLRVLVESGVAEKAEKTIPGSEGVKARKVQSYKLA